MKKTNLIPVLCIMSLLMMACEKNADSLSSGNNGNGDQTVVAPGVIASNWFSLAFTTVVNNGDTWLQALEPYNSTTGSAYDKTRYVELAYAMMPDPLTSVVYRRLPLLLPDPSGNSADVFSFDFALNNTGFELKVKNTNLHGSIPDSSFFSGFKYRFLIIAKSKYQSLNIDWDDYSRVVQELNIPR